MDVSLGGYDPVYERIKQEMASESEPIVEFRFVAEDDQIAGAAREFFNMTALTAYLTSFILKYGRNPWMDCELKIRKHWNTVHLIERSNAP